VIRFVSATSAEKAIDFFNGRTLSFSSRKVECFYYDGKTNYSVGESEKDFQKRVDSFGAWLEGKET